MAKMRSGPSKKKNFRFQQLGNNPISAYIIYSKKKGVLTMADLLPSLPSDDERPSIEDNNSDEEDDADEVDKSFQFGGILVSLS